MMSIVLGLIALILLIPIIAALFVIIQLLGWTIGILVDAGLAFLVIVIIWKVLDELF